MNGNQGAVNANLHPVIGIDLGTTYSAVTIYNRFSETSEVIEDKEKDVSAGQGLTTPSVVSFDRTQGRVIVGHAAKRNLPVDPDNTVMEIKREMGGVFNADLLKKYRAEGMFHEGEPVKVHFCNEWFLPQEISAFTLMKMKRIAEEAYGGPIQDAVVTVPAYFTEKQKKATEEAARLAGLYPRQLLPEPTAAAICYGLERYEPTRKVYLVYDLGGGTFDVSIIAVEESKIDVIATSGDSRLGGGDFDEEITLWAMEQLRTRHGLDVSSNRGVRASIRLKAEELKKSLGLCESAKMVLPEVGLETAPVLELTQAQFLGMIEKHLDKSLSCVDEAIRQAEKEKDVHRDQIDAILLVGGSSKIPRVKTKLLDYFRKDENFVRSDVDGDLVVARGAGRVALKFRPVPGPFNIATRPDAGLVNADAQGDMDVHLITEHSLGIGVQHDLVEKIIDRGTSIPTRRRQPNFANAGPTEHVIVNVYQGEGQYVYLNTLIGTLPLGPMSPQPEGFHKFDVEFALDSSGLLSCTIYHLNENKQYHGQFTQPTGVGGDKAMAMRHEWLVKMFTGTVQAHPVMPGFVPPAPPRPPIPPTGVPGAVPPLPGAVPGVPAAGAAGVAPAAPAPLAGGTALSPLPGAGPVSGAAATAPQQGPAADPAIDGLTHLIAEPPIEFKGLVRRVQKLLLKAHKQELVAAFNAFAAAVNAGRPADEIQELGDDLENVYQDCRR